MGSLLDHLTLPQQIDTLSYDDLDVLAKDIRNRILDVMSVNGGHLGSNLGIVELTIALHKVFNSPLDKFIFDVSHQCYPHKLLTGRHERFDSIRQHKGICGFTHPQESVHDHFYAGHAGNALSLALGLAKSAEFTGAKDYILPILGDAPLTCGLTLEALNNIPKDVKRFIAILNDNAMAISENVGAITNILSRIINNPTTNKFYLEIESILSKIPGYGLFLAKQGHKVKESVKNLVSPAPFFEQYGLNYIGPIDGHDIRKLSETFEALKGNNKPTIVHVLTTKGKGLGIAIENPTPYHGAKPFNRDTGVFHPSSKQTFPKIFGKHLLEMADKDPTIIAITPAMPAGSCLDKFMKKYPKRCIDVGIAEGHSVTYAGGIAFGKKMKVVAILYSSFLQRALDNVFHDVCLQRLPVLIAIDRAGISGGDGVNMNGIYDIGFLNSMPNMVITQPRNGHVLKELLESAFDWNSPACIRYPNLPTTEEDLPLKKRELGRAEILSEGSGIALISMGHMCDTALDVKTKLLEKGLNPTVIDPVFIKPLDAELFYRMIETHQVIITMEEHSLQTGLGSIINSFILKNGFTNKQVLNFGVPDTYVEHGKHALLLKELGLDADAITAKILKHFSLKEVTV